jgi:hypothetical protein
MPVMSLGNWGCSNRGHKTDLVVLNGPGGRGQSTALILLGKTPCLCASISISNSEQGRVAYVLAGRDKLYQTYLELKTRCARPYSLGTAKEAMTNG